MSSTEGHLQSLSYPYYFIHWLLHEISFTSHLPLLVAILEDTEKADSLLIMSADQIIIRLHHISLKEQRIIDLSYSLGYFFLK